jgi:chromosomal replication initiation ATPase DnaA
METITQEIESGKKKTLIRLVKDAQLYADLYFPKTYVVTLRELEYMKKEEFEKIANETINKICEFLDLNVTLFKSHSRKRRYVDARVMFSAYILSSYTRVSLDQIGLMINRDHSTIHHNKGRHEDAMEFITSYKDTYNRLCQILDNKC